jgi:sec-independent protein translocase protein TatB
VFNLQGSEIVIVLLLALVVLGPEKLPDAIRKVGQFYAELKKMSSGFQSEFRAAVDEPMREMRDTANILRDSADFTKLQDGDRDEKPKSAEMGPVPGVEPTDAPASVAGPAAAGDTDGPELAADSKPAPFSDQSSNEPRPAPDAPRADETVRNEITESASMQPVDGDAPTPAADSKPAPFAGRSSAAPRPQPVEGDPVGDVAGAADGDVDGSALVETGDEPSPAVGPSDADDATGRAR